MIVLITQLCPILCESMDCSLSGSSVHGIIQARILEWAPIPFSRVPSQPRDWIQVSMQGDFYHLRSRNGHAEEQRKCLQGSEKFSKTGLWWLISLPWEITKKILKFLNYIKTHRMSEFMFWKLCLNKAVLIKGKTKS